LHLLHTALLMIAIFKHIHILQWTY